MQKPNISEIPTAPGVYRYWDKNDRVIYVGKAKNLRARLSSYFNDPRNLHRRTREMVRTATRLDWVTVNNEIEALQLEHTWINEYEPRYNIRFRDDKSYPWLAVTMSDEFPRVLVVRGARRKGWKYFGPCVHGWALRESVDRLLRVYPVRTCSDSGFRQAKASGRPCLLGYIDKCSAPCVGRISAVDHRELVDGLLGVFEGKSSALLRELKIKMNDAAAAQDYESAARYRDDLAAVETVAQRTKVMLDQGVDCDFVGLAADELAACIQLFHVRDGHLVGQRSYLTDRPDEVDESGLISFGLRQIYGEGDVLVPSEVLVSAPPLDGDAEFLSHLAGKQVQIRNPQRGDKSALMQTVISNAQQALALYRSRRGADMAARGAALSELGEALGLDDAPLRIECIDVSHLDGNAVVASLVVFEDGLPTKRDYRRFSLKHGLGNNDVASIAEVVTRRFTPSETATERRKSFSYRPNLLVVDGGKPQVAAAVAALAGIGIDLPVVGLAKRLEEVWPAGADDPVVLPRNSEALFLLQRIRDEAHRFAIALQRKQVRKQSISSVLDGVEGLGPARKQALLKHFGSVKKLRSATASEVAEVPGIGPALAATITRTLQELSAGVSVNTATGEIVEES